MLSGHWAAPLVPVLKSDDLARLCGDYKVTVNQISKLEQYPIHRIEDLFAAFRWTKVHKIRPESYISPDPLGRGSKEVCDSKYPQTFVHLQSATFCHFIKPSYRIYLTNIKHA